MAILAWGGAANKRFRRDVTQPPRNRAHNAAHTAVPVTQQTTGSRTAAPGPPHHDRRPVPRRDRERVAREPHQVGPGPDGERAPLALLEGLVGGAGRVRGQGCLRRQPLVRQPALRGAAVGSLPGDRDGQPVERPVRADRPVTAHREHRTGRDEGGEGVLQSGATGPQARHREVQLQRVELSPQRLDIGDHAELGEAWEVAGVDQLGMGDDRAPVARPVDPDNVLDGVEGIADARVTDGVDVQPKAVGIERGRRRRQLVAAPDRQPAAVRPVGVGSQQRGRARLHDAVGEELHRARGDQRGLRRHRACGGKGRPLRRPLPRLGTQRDVDPDGQRSAVRCVEVDRDVVGVQRRLLRPGDAGRREHARGRGQPLDLLRERRGRRVAQHQVHRGPLDQRPHRAAVGPACDCCRRRVSGVLIDAGDPKGGGVGPGTVVVGRLQHDRPIGHCGVEPLRVEQSIRREAGVVGAAADPARLRVVGCPPSHDVGHLPHRGGVANLRAGELDPAPQRVYVAVAERGQQGSALEVGDLEGVVGER